MFIIALAILAYVNPYFPYVRYLHRYDSFNFAVIGDTQDRKHIMKKASLSMRKQDLSLGVHLGDIDYCGSLYKWKKSKSLMRLSGLPWYITIGNHELYASAIPISGFYGKRRWSRYWWRDDTTFHTVDHLGKRFIFIDSASFYYPKGENERLASALETSKDKSVFIITHKPLPYHTNIKIRFGENKLRWHSYKTMEGSWYAGRNRDIWNTIKKYQNKILAVFHGHYHAFRAYTLDGIKVYCSGGGGGTLETNDDFYHYLIIGVRGNNFYVKVIKL